MFKENDGQESTFNTDFEQSGGFDIVIFLDSDDYWYPEKLEKIAAYHQTHDLVEYNLKT